jgi:hypothetical protein
MLYDRSLCYPSMGEEERLERMSRQAASIPGRSPVTNSNFLLRFAREGLGVIN